MLYAALQLALKFLPAASSNARYHLSLSTLMTLLVWFIGTWWQQYHIVAHEQLAITGALPAVTVQQPLAAVRVFADHTRFPFGPSVQLAAPWLAACYLTGLALMLVRLSGGMRQIFSLKKNGATQPDQAMQQLLQVLKNRLGITSHVRFLISVKAGVPMVIGFLKPVILVPAAAVAQLSPAQLETILLHELAHIRRHDYLVNILQAVAETILFFNPFAWMISAVVRREREHCCDDIVMAQTSEPMAYATALATLAGHYHPGSALTIAASGRSNQLLNRIKRIMEMKKTPFSYSRFAAALLITMTITASVVWLNPSFAKPKDPAAVTTGSKTGDAELLIQRLTADGLIEPGKGYVVTKKLDKLFIDGRQQPDGIAAKYLSGIKRPNVSIQVMPYMYWQPKSASLKFLPPAMFPAIADTLQPGC